MTQFRTLFQVLPGGSGEPISDTIPGFFLEVLMTQFRTLWRFWRTNFGHYSRICLEVLMTQFRTLSQDLPEGSGEPISDTIPGFAWRFWWPNFGQYSRIYLKFLATDGQKLSLRLPGHKFRQYSSICLEEWMELLRSPVRYLDQDMNSVFISIVCLVNDKIMHIGCYRQ